ncbi:MAG TPA: DUF3014 domain-containing protein [Burkholderiales bacterium]
MSEKAQSPTVPILLVLFVLAVAGVGGYYWLQSSKPQVEKFTTPPLSSGPIGKPEVRHPIGPGGAAETLPALGESDDALREEAKTLLGDAPLEKLFNLDSIVRRIVVTIDELPREKIAQRYNLAKPAPGRFRTLGKGDSAKLSAANYERYRPYVRLAESVDTRKLVALYVHFYPLLQQEYENLGYPGRYFNDRVIETIDHLLAAPEIHEPIELIQPKVMYEFADSRLERLSAGQKIMIRMGPENAARIKTKLREIREALVAHSREADRTALR